MFIDRELTRRRVEAVEARGMGTEPQFPLRVLDQFQIKQVSDLRIELIPGKAFRRGVKPIQAIPGRGPQRTVVIH
jgi:hypothetical protein